jgi:hypothetical protein
MYLTRVPLIIVYGPGVGRVPGVALDRSDHDGGVRVADPWE